MGLCFYGGLRPSEAVAIRWEDFRFRDSLWFVNIARGCVEGNVADTKTEGSKPSVPIAKQLRELIQVWHSKSGNKKEGWMFPAKKGAIDLRSTKPMDLRNLCQCQIKPTVTAPGFEWKGLYAFRRGLTTHLKDLGDVVSAQAMLRHKNPDTTESYYAKLTAADRLRAIRFLEAGTEANNPSRISRLGVFQSGQV
jgi:integrase